MENEDIIKKLEPKTKKLFEIALPYLEKGTPGTIEHVYDLINELIDFKSNKIKIDLTILLPLAILHDIGHYAILPEHFHYLTGPAKIKNSKLIHMLTGAKIAKELLEKIDYDKNKTKEIVEIISIHDFDQLEGVDTSVFDTENKKIFHDFDRIGQFNEERMKIFIKNFVKDKEQLKKIKETISKTKESLFFEEFKKIAEERMKNIEHLIK